MTAERDMSQTKTPFLGGIMVTQWHKQRDAPETVFSPQVVYCWPSLPGDMEEMPCQVFTAL